MHTSISPGRPIRSAVIWCVVTRIRSIRELSKRCQPVGQQLIILRVAEKGLEQLNCKPYNGFEIFCHFIAMHQQRLRPTSAIIHSA